MHMPNGLASTGNLSTEMHLLRMWPGMLDRGEMNSKEKFNIEFLEAGALL